jgi:aminodeoxyfutalosine synthase
MLKPRGDMLKPRGYGRRTATRERTTMTLNDLEIVVAGGHALTRAQAERVLASADLVTTGELGETARKARTGDLVTFGRVVEIRGEALRENIGEAGEVRITGAPTSVEDACERTRAAAAIAGGVPVTGFSLVDLAALAGGDSAALTAAARALSEAGLAAVAEVPADAFASAEDLVAAVEGARRGGLGAWRVTVNRGAMNDRLDLIERVVRLQRTSGDVRAFAPLPRLDPPDEPSTGYDDVRTVAIARLMAADIPVIQVDWPLYGPKLAQVAIAYGAGDIDGVAPVDAPALGPRRAARAEIERQIRAASAVPVERNGRYERRHAR